MYRLCWGCKVLGDVYAHSTPSLTTPSLLSEVHPVLLLLLPNCTQAEVAFNMGLIDTRQRREAEAIQTEVVDLVLNRQWVKARKRSDELLAYITNASASATLEDIRRDKGYDAEDRVSTYLNLPGELPWGFRGGNIRLSQSFLALKLFVHNVHRQSQTMTYGICCSFENCLQR
jgi:hypothetical protein